MVGSWWGWGSFDLQENCTLLFHLPTVISFGASFNDVAITDDGYLFAVDSAGSLLAFQQQPNLLFFTVYEEHGSIVYASVVVNAEGEVIVGGIEQHENLHI